MEIFDKDTHYLLNPNIQTITEKAARQIYDCVKSLDKPAVIDMYGVEDCVNGFFKILQKMSNMSLFNIDSKILSTIFMTGYDKYVTIYGDEVAYEDNSRALINRQFNIVS